MGKLFALKVLHAAMGENDEVATRFEREAVAASHIDHVNVAPATDFGRTADRHFVDAGVAVARRQESGGPPPSSAMASSEISSPSLIIGNVTIFFVCPWQLLKQRAYSPCVNFPRRRRVWRRREDGTMRADLYGPA
jgi:hypothetical protein